MKNLLFIPFLFCVIVNYAQKDTVYIRQPKQYKKRVLENAEINVLSSFYSQDGKHAAVTGGVGIEKLTDFATDITVSVPLNDDDVLTIDGTISAYTSASSSNLNPFPDEEDMYGITNVSGTPWMASSGASRQDVWTSGNIAYSHSSDDRNTIWGTHLNIANEYDYFSFGIGGDLAKLYNQKNTELDLKANVYFDTWRPVYPTELEKYLDYSGNLNYGFFSTINILDQNGNPANSWNPTMKQFIQNKGRNTFSFSFNFSQILTKKLQISLFSDIILQQGWLANPMQRVYFADKANFYVGNPAYIPNYSSPVNTDVFQLADDIERLPHTRLKIPIGERTVFYLNEFLVLRTYYRFYFDDWGIFSHTVNIELPLKIASIFTIYPSYRFYNQTASKYFAPFDKHISTEKFYTSDYDLSKYNANQFGLGIKYTDILTKAHIWKFGLKTLNLEYAHYYRNIKFKADIISFGATIIFNN